MQLLVIDQDDVAARVLGAAARRRGHKTFYASDTLSVPSTLPFEPSACVCGVDVEDPSVLERLQPLTERYPKLLMVLTPESVREPMPLQALRAGVCDIVRKPYNPFELIERIERIAASRGVRADAEEQRAGDVIVDLAHYGASKNGVDLGLTKLELRLLYCLMAHRNRLTPTEKLLTFGWEGDDPPDPSLLKTHVSHLRTKLGRAGGPVIEIRSKHSLGYTLSLEESA
jgi:DNA-binding response OmpR family regulator